MHVTFWGHTEIQDAGDAVRSLFHTCFGQAMELALFHQLYQANPFGTPKAVTLHDKGALVGFYGLHPQVLARQGTDERQDYLLGTTLMIHPAFRGMEAFFSLMNAVRRMVKDDAIPFVLGFPNEQSFLPLVRFFRWKQVEETSFLAYDAEPFDAAGPDVQPIEAPTLHDTWSAPYDDPRFMAWKGLRHTYHTVRVGDGFEVVYKRLDASTLDVVDVRCERGVEQGTRRLEALVAETATRTVVVTSYHAARLGLPAETLRPWSDYTIRLCALPGAVPVPDLHLSLLLSDVF